MIDDQLSTSAQRVQDALSRQGLSRKVVELPGSTRTALEAAQAVGCSVGQIVKSLVFRTKLTRKAILILASGSNRVDEKLVENLIGEPIERADPDFVREQTGFAIGGIPPIGHANPLTTLIDDDLLNYEEVWAAAGTPHAVFPIDPKELERITNGKIASIRLITGATSA
jgi:prolyl-tRNA editing enzyme YbaK/EbsC (Cys-tRNA(Pro) deacylase)